MENKLIMSSSPHIHTSATTTKIMLDVIIALIPAAVMGVYFFGFRAALVIAAAVLSAVAAEWIFEKIFSWGGSRWTSWGMWITKRCGVMRTSF